MVKWSNFNYTKIFWIMLNTVKLTRTLCSIISFNTQVCLNNRIILETEKWFKTITVIYLYQLRAFSKWETAYYMFFNFSVSLSFNNFNPSQISQLPRSPIPDPVMLNDNCYFVQTFAYNSTTVRAAAAVEGGEASAFMFIANVCYC